MLVHPPEAALLAGVEPEGAARVDAARDAVVDRHERLCGEGRDLTRPDPMMQASQ